MTKETKTLASFLSEAICRKTGGGYTFLGVIPESQFKGHILLRISETRGIAQNVRLGRAIIGDQREGENFPYCRLFPNRASTVTRSFVLDCSKHHLYFVSRVL